MTSEAVPRPKGMCIATRCTSVEHFVEMFHRFVDEDSFFVSTLNTRPPGLETSFSVQLADGTPVLQGMCVVLQAWTTSRSPFKTPGVRLGIKRLTAASMPIFERLVVTRSRPTLTPPMPSAELAAGTAKPTTMDSAPKEIGGGTTHPDLARAATATGSTIPNLAPPPLANGTPAPRVTGPSTSPRSLPPRRIGPPAVGSTTIPRVAPPPDAVRTETTEVEAARFPEATPTKPAPAPHEERTPGSDLVLPANPLMNLSDASLEGYVDCTLYEETGTFFPTDAETFPIGDLAAASSAEPPALSPRPVAIDSQPVEIIADEPPETAEPLPDFAFASRESAPAGELSPVRARATTQRTRTRTPSRTHLIFGAVGLLAAGVLAIWMFSGGDKPASAANESSANQPAPSAAPDDPESAGLAPSKEAAAGTAEPAPSTDDKAGEPDVPSVATAGEPDVPSDPTDGEPDAPSGDSELPAADGALPELSAAVVGDGPCRIAVTSTPAGSIVRLDGKAVAPSPITLATTCERHKIEIKHPRYQLVTKFVRPEADQPATVDVTMQRPTHSIVVTSKPAGATVFIGGRRAGTTPTKLSVLGFVNLKLELKKTGYAPVQTRFYSKRANDRFSVSLRKW